jgi:hypothetical protein
MSKWLQDRMRIPRRPEIKIHTEKTEVGRLQVRECQVHDGLRLTTGRHPEANLTREEALTLAAWLTAWATATEEAP